MPLASRLTRRALRLSAVTSACVAALSTVLPASAESSITVGVNNWLGTASPYGGNDSDWFNAANWWAGPLFGLPTPLFPVYIGPTQIIFNGVPTSTFDLPGSEAVLGGPFTMSSLDMRAWDGISQLRLTTGALLNTNATIGGVNSTYTPNGAIRPATLVLDGGNTAGNWNFLEQSRVVVNAVYGQPGGNWSGNLGQLQINSSAALSFAAGSNFTIGQVGNSGGLEVSGGSSLTVAGSFQNSGSFTLGGDGNTGTAALYLSGNTTLTGNGTTLLTDANYSYIGGSAVLTVDAGHTLRGSGYVATGLANRGTVIADGVLTVSANGNFDNSGGTVQVVDGSVLLLASGSFSGGELQGLGAGSRFSGAGTFQNLVLSGQFFVAPGSPVQVAGVLMNTGTLTLGGSGNQGTAAMYLAGDTTLAGTGSLVLTDANYSYIGGGGVLTIGSSQTLRGAGYVATSITNQGTVIADGELTFNAGGNFDNSSGKVLVTDGSTLSLSSGIFSGGTVKGLGTGSQLGGNGTFNATALSGSLQLTGSTTLDGVANAGALTLRAGANTSTKGTLTNNGTLTIGGNSNLGSAALYLVADTTLAGTGSTVLTDPSYSYIGGSSVLTIANGHTLRGAGFVAASIANQGKVIADGVLTVNAGSNSQFDNTGGTVQVADGGLLSLSGGSFSGGLLQGLGPGSRFGGTGTFQNLALSGQFTVAAGSSTTVAGTLTNSGTLTLGGNGNQGTAALYLAADTTLAGSGTTVLTDANYSYIGGSSGLVVGGDHTLRGAGYMAVSLTNQGTVQVGARDLLVVAGGTLQNQGQLQVLAEGALDSGNVLQTNASAKTTVNGLLRAQTLTLNAGTLQGSGTVQAEVLNLGGTINAGNSPGKLSITGNLTLGDDSLLLVEVAGTDRGTQFDWLAVTGNVVLDGDLQLEFVGYTPQTGQQFSFLTSSEGTISGRFDNVWANGWEVSVQYDANGLTATVSAVPEPGSWALALLGVAGLGAWLRRVDRIPA